MIIAVDIDDVCAALVPAWLARYNARFDDNVTRETCTEWELTKIVKPECGAAIYDILKEDDLYFDVEPIDGARVGVETLRAYGHDVIFVTSCGYDPATISASAGAKLEWLQTWGFLPNDASAVKSYIVASDKSRIVADVLIDDRPLNIEKWPRRGLLFDQPHNRNLQLDESWSEVDGYQNATRVLNWIEAVRALTP